jgi:peptidyl-prolyl cis-trans isomerase C
MAWQAAARALIVRELLLQEARRTGIDAKPEVDQAGRREADEEAMIRMLIERDVITPEPDDDSCRRYYQQNRRRFRSQDIYEASHILFAAKADDPDAFAGSRANAQAVLAILRGRPELFAELAALHSACPSGVQGGNLGQITAGGTTPEFEQALFSLEVGALTTAPVATRYGHHLIRLDAKHNGRELSYELVAGAIADYLRDSVRRRATAQYIARLVSAAQIEGIDLADRDSLRVH